MVTTESASKYELGSTNLFKPIKVGNKTLRNRLFYPPTTRLRATSDGVPTTDMLEYYTQRARNCGLIVVEGTHPTLGSTGMQGAPGIWTEQQARAWKRIVDAVHEQGCAIAVQFWPLGRQADPAVLKAVGKPYISSSAIYIDEEGEKNAIKAGNPLKAMTLEEIEEFKNEYLYAAKNAINIAGFDFIESHGAHGYLFNQFINSSSNNRTDKYGGSIENRARLLLEVTDMMIDAVGADKLAVRLSPWATFGGLRGADEDVHPIAQIGYVLSELERRKIAYVSIVEPRVDGAASTDLSEETLRSRDNRWIYEIFKSGVVIRAGSYTHDREDGYALLKAHVNSDDRTMIGSCRFFTSNPDLPSRLEKGLELTPYNRDLFYSKGSYGYISWADYGGVELAADHPRLKQASEPLA